MPNLLIVYYSRSGNTKKMADLVAEGARQVPGVSVTVQSVADTSPDQLLDAHAIIMGSPVYYGTMAAPLKALIDKSVMHHRKLDGKVGAAFTSSGADHGGNETTVLDIDKALLVHGMIIQGDPEGDHYGAVAVGSPDERAANSCRRMGKRVAQLTLKLFP